VRLRYRDVNEIVRALQAEGAAGDVRTVQCALKHRSERLMYAVESLASVLQGGGISPTVDVVIPTTVFVSVGDLVWEYSIPRYRRWRGWCRDDSFSVKDANMQIHDDRDPPLMECRGKTFHVHRDSLEDARVLASRAGGLAS